jgi:hypothetical protein
MKVDTSLTASFAGATDVARIAKDAGYDDLWSDDAGRADPFLSMAVL